MHILPFPNSRLGKEVLPARLAKLAAAEVTLKPVDEIPEFEVGEKVRIGVGEFGLCLIGRLLLILRTLARVLDFQSGSDDEDVGEASFLVGGENDAANARIDGELCQLAAKRS